MAVDALVRQLGDAWGWILLRGLASIAFGALAVLWPGMTIVVLVIMSAARGRAALNAPAALGKNFHASR